MNKLRLGYKCANTRYGGTVNRVTLQPGGMHQRAILLPLLFTAYVGVEIKGPCQIRQIYSTRLLFKFKLNNG